MDGLLGRLVADAPTSRIPGFHQLKMDQRIARVAELAGLDAAEQVMLRGAAGESGAHPGDRFDRMIENFVGSLGMPLGIATNFIVDGVERLVPMAIEEPSVVAAASNAARMARDAGGFVTEMKEDRMIGQIHLLDVPDPKAAEVAIMAARARLLKAAEPTESALTAMGAGSMDLQVRHVVTKLGPVVIVHLVVDTRDAMGANAVNTRAEALASELVALVGGRVRLRILSNLADRRVVTARGTFGRDAVGGAEVVQGILEAQALAEADPYRAATHNKGVMNGVDAVVVATGNDWRAVEAGAHAFAARSGSYQPLTTYESDADGNLVGTLSLPVAVGVVGGATKANPIAALAVKILGVQTSQELARTCAAVGLAQNLAALRALASEGIQAGHMRLHKRLDSRA